MFFYEKWVVFTLGLEMTEIAEQLSKHPPPGWAKEMDNLRRAAFSYVNNLAEGAMRREKGPKLHFYDITRGFAGEYNGSLRNLIRVHKNKQLCQRGMDIASKASALMLNLIRSVEENYQ